MESPPKYLIYTTTSNFPDAGFNSNVYIQIFGMQKRASSSSSSPPRQNNSHESNRVLTSLRFPLQISKNNAKKFRPGQTDLFEIELDQQVELQSIKKIRLTHNSCNTRWHLKHLVVKQEGGRVWKFQCSQWIDASELGVELSPLKKDSPEYESIKVENEENEDRARGSDNESDYKSKDKRDLEMIRYKIKIITSEISKIEPGLKIKLKLIGTQAQTGWIKVDFNDLKFPMIHIFKAEETDVGMVFYLLNNLKLANVHIFHCSKIERLLISIKNKENGKLFDWFFDEIVVVVHKFKTFMYKKEIF